MTKRNRLDEIADFSNYLQQIYNQYRSHLKPDVKICLLGFSQGVATVIRWMLQKQPDFDHLILWSGFAPEDMDYMPYQTYLKDKRFHFLYGDEDQFLTPERLEWHREVLDRIPTNIEIYPFKGKHVIPKQELIKLRDKLMETK